jgi:ParB family chromosome partitioning protein
MSKLTYKSTEVALGKLVLHPKNVRAASGHGYDAGSIAPLAANIATFGLLQPLLVQVLEGGQYGVLAGGRRLAALQKLCEDSVKGFGLRSKVQVNLVGADVDGATALSLSENILALPMDALDRFEAFDAMRLEGQGIDEIARAFGITERSVRESMRLGQIDLLIRESYRSGEINLETLREFAGHPDQAVQLSVFTQLREDNALAQWRVRSAFQKQYTRKGSDLGQLVFDAYVKLGGVVKADLIDEDSVLEDDHLVQQALNTVLSDLAEEERGKLGFAWAEVAVDPEWNAFQDYGRVYPEPKDIGEEEQVKVDQLTEELDALAAEYEAAEDWHTQEEIEAKHEAKQAEIDALTQVYSDFDLGIAGVIAIWCNGSVRFEYGMVRPEDMPDDSSDGTGDDASSVGQGGQVRDADTSKPAYSAKLTDDLKELRTRAVAIALAQSPDLARDYAEFTIVAKALGNYVAFGDFGLDLSIGNPISPAKDPEGSRLAIEEVDAALLAGLDLAWAEKETRPEQFKAYRETPSEARGALLAYAVASTLHPSAYDASGRSLRALVEFEALPDIREAWTPDAAFLKRLTKPQLLAILRNDLGMPNKADAYANLKKSEVVEIIAGLFVSDNVTIGGEVQAKIAAWAPEIMRTSDVGAGEADGASADGLEDQPNEAASGAAAELVSDGRSDGNVETVNSRHDTGAEMAEAA